MRAAPHSPRARDRVALLLLVTALGLAALRFLRLGTYGLWFDEALTLADAFLREEFKNPLGYRLFGSFYALLPERPDEFQLRLPAAVFGAASILLTAFAFRPMAGPRAAWAAAVLVGLSSWHMYWSQTARFYTLSMCLTLIGCGLFVRALRSRSTLLGLLGLGLAALAALAHPTAALVLPGLVVAALWFWKGSFDIDPEGRWRAPNLGRVLLVSAVLGTALGVPLAVKLIASWQAAKGFGTPLHLVLTGGFYFTPLLLCGLLVGLSELVRRRSPALALAACVVLLGGLGGLAASVLARMSAQYLFGLLPFAALLAAAPWVRDDETGADVPDPDVVDPTTVPNASAAAGAATHPAARRPPLGAYAAGIYFAVLALPAAAPLGLYFSVRQGERPPWREAYRFVHDELRPGDLVLGMAPAVGEYYLDPLAIDLRRPEHVVYLDDWRRQEPEIWDRTGRRTWYVVNFERLQDWRPENRRELQRSLAEDCRLVARYPLVVESRDLSVYVYVR